MKLLRIDDVAEVLDVSRARAYELVREGCCLWYAWVDRSGLIQASWRHGWTRVESDSNARTRHRPRNSPSRRDWRRGNVSPIDGQPDNRAQARVEKSARLQNISTITLDFVNKILE